ncbi:MAG TPA: hypothetical protein DIC52_20010 [Candidatus Latescibacteria bacterium]|nr:hypothetical protein [Candidatus Latescibacterota bacterium]
MGIGVVVTQSLHARARRRTGLLLPPVVGVEYRLDWTDVVGESVTEQIDGTDRGGDGEFRRRDSPYLGIVSAHGNHVRQGIEDVVVGDRQAAHAEGDGALEVILELGCGVVTPVGVQVQVVLRCGVAHTCLKRL